MNFKFHFAPIRGITEPHFFEQYHRHFPQFDSYMTPFVAPGAPKKIQKQLTSFPRNDTTTMPLVPQVLARNATELVSLSNHFFARGYTTVNLNLGCPYPMVIKKGRGAALLSQPEKVVTMLEEAIPQLLGHLSIKARLGLQSAQELPLLIEKFEKKLARFPLQKLVIHGRTAEQMYGGRCNFETVAQMISTCPFPVVLNGDITQSAHVASLRERFPTIAGIMVGRGALANPFIVAMLKNTPLPNHNQQMQRLNEFHASLVCHYQKKLQGDAHFLQKMKDHWQYFQWWFDAPKAAAKAIRKANSIAQYLETTSMLFQHMSQ